MTDEGLTLILRDQVLAAEDKRSFWWRIGGMAVALGVSILCWTMLIYAWLWVKGWL